MTNKISPRPSIEEVLVQFSHWRANKKQTGSRTIPDELWLACFSLESVLEPSKIQSLLGLNSTQYKDKKHALKSNPTSKASQAINTEAMDFVCVEQVKASGNEPGPQGSPASNHVSPPKPETRQVPNYIDVTTIIVECVRPDGYRLNINTTMDSITDVMQAFFKAKEIEPC